MSESVKPEAWVLTRHNHPDYDETIYYDEQSAWDDAELDSDDLPEGEYRHKPRPLYGQEIATRFATATELLREMQAMLEQLPTGIDTEADEKDTSPEDMVAHIGGLMWKRLAAFLEGCKPDNPEAKA